MYIVSVINYKGGVGKTTITANLSTELAWRGFNVLMIDLDPQANLTFSFVRPEVWASDYSKSKTIQNWFESFESRKFKNLPELIFSPKRIQESLKGKGKLDLIASHLDLLNIDLALAQELGGSTLKQSKRNFLKVHRRLANGLAQIEEGKYDIIIIDCPPNFNVVTKTAIVVSSHLLIPARPDYLSTIGIDYLIRQLARLKEDYNDFIHLDEDDNELQEINPKIVGVLFNMVQVYGGEPISVSRIYFRQVEKIGLPVFKTYIRESKTLHSEAAQYGIPVTFMASGKTSTTSKNVVKEIENFVTEFQKKLNLWK